jgi:hypothetical protein
MLKHRYEVTSVQKDLRNQGLVCSNELIKSDALAHQPPPAAPAPPSVGTWGGSGRP